MQENVSIPDGAVSSQRCKLTTALQSSASRYFVATSPMLGPVSSGFNLFG